MKTREILFRGKRLDNDEWIYGQSMISLRNPFDEGSLGGIIYMPIPGEKIKIKFDKDFNFDGFEDGKFYEVDERTLCQYTGLRDANGTKIFENDIIRPRDYFVGDGIFYQIKFEGGAFCYSLVGTKGSCGDPIFDNEFGIDTQDFIVIGNLIDYQELWRKLNDEKTSN